MKVMVISDSHGAFGAIDTLLEQNPGIVNVIFLGDGLAEMEDIRNIHPERNFYCVAGNCDFGAPEPAERVVELGGHRIFMTHGHCYGVKSGDLNMLRRAAKKQDCDIALYGHTHEARTDYMRGIYVCNPGSLRFSSGGKSWLELNLDGPNVVPVIVPLE